jgi:cysteine/O-acetylserine efflux protein
MKFEILSIITFALITTFTPGPNNISSASVGLNNGYIKTLPYLLGIFSGFFVIMILSAFLSVSLINTFPRIERILAIVGSLYILWLAYHTLIANYNFEDEKKSPLGFFRGFLLQILNPKVIIYGITLYSTFLKDLPRYSFQLPLTALFFAFISFCSISTWTLFGSFIRKYLTNIKAKLILNVFMSLLLVLTAVKISGII